MGRNSRLEQRGRCSSRGEGSAEGRPDLDSLDAGDRVGRGLRRREGQEITEGKRGGVRGGRGAGGDAVHLMVGKRQRLPGIGGAGKRKQGHACEQ